MTNTRDAISRVLTDYAAALRADDADAVLRLWANDGVLLAQESPTAVGPAAVRAAYAGLAGAVHLDIAFHVAEVVETGPGWAFARTTSTGTMRINATGATVPEANQELFIFRHVGGGWKIARYAFSVVNPPPRP